MVEPGREVTLGREPLPAEHRRQLGQQRLERHVAIVLEVVREADRGHAALARLAVEAVAVLEGGGEECRRIRCAAEWARITATRIG